MSTEQRRYTLRARAERQDATRRRIVAATEDLHREVGPARTTIAEIARRAGVQRLTVYNNFPTGSELFAACQLHFLAGHPPPELSGDLANALREQYEWYRANQDMARNVQRDRRLLPELDALLRVTSDAALDTAAAAYAAQLGGGELLLRLAFDFQTWDLLAQRGATDAEIAALFAEALRGPAPGRSGSAAPRSSPRRSR